MNRRILFRLSGVGLAALLCLLSLALPAWASTPCDPYLSRLSEVQTRHQLRTFVECAADHAQEVGWTQAMEDFKTSPAWLGGGLYLFAADYDGLVEFIGVGHTPPGTDLSQLQDSRGQYPVQDMSRIARQYGAGFSYYWFANPLTGEEEPKESYVTTVTVEGEPLVLGAGVYPLDVVQSCSPEQVRASRIFSTADVERYVNCGAHHLRERGLLALHDFSVDPRWNSGPHYLFMVDLETRLVAYHGANPALVNTPITPDTHGVAFDQEAARIAETFGTGYAYYEFINPASGQTEPKISFVRKVSFGRRDYALAAGVYIPEVCAGIPTALAVDTEAELEAFVTCAHTLLEERGTDAYDLFLHHPQFIDGATYVYVLDMECRNVVYPLDYRADQDDCMQEDEHGMRVSQAIVDTGTSEAGAGWVEYHWLNPASDQVERKVAYVMGAEVEGETLIVGAGVYLAE